MSSREVQREEKDKNIELKKDVSYTNYLRELEEMKRKDTQSRTRPIYSDRVAPMEINRISSNSQESFPIKIKFNRADTEGNSYKVKEDIESFYN